MARAATVVIRGGYVREIGRRKVEDRYDKWANLVICSNNF
jgi:hypothetical protein